MWSSDSNISSISIWLHKNHINDVQSMPVSNKNPPKIASMSAIIHCSSGKTSGVSILVYHSPHQSTPSKVHITSMMFYTYQKWNKSWFIGALCCLSSLLWTSSLPVYSHIYQCTPSPEDHRGQGVNLQRPKDCMKHHHCHQDTWPQQHHTAGGKRWMVPCAH